MTPDLRRDARWALIVLTGLNLVNYLDRYIVPAVQAKIGKELNLDDAQLGLLTTAFMVVYMIASPIFGWLGDRHSRTRLIGIGVAVWSVSTATTGLGTVFALLLLSRMAVGIGEAAYGTIAPAMLSDFYPRNERGRVYAFFYAAIPIGSALGYILGGWIGGTWGWRHAFILTAIPGLLLAALAFRLVDPPRGAQAEGGGGGHEEGVLSTYRSLWANRPYVVAVAGYAAGTFAIGGLGVWLPTFLLRVHDVKNAGEVVGPIMAVSGLLGTMAGGWISDWYARRNNAAYLWVGAWASLLAVPFTVVALNAPQPHLYYPAIFVAALLVFSTTGPINTEVVNVVRSEVRATALAACTLAIHCLGDAPSPLIIGAISDSTGSLSKALLIVPVVMALSGAIFVYAALTKPAAEKQPADESAGAAR